MNRDDRLSRWLQRYGAPGELAPVTTIDVVDWLRMWAQGIREMLLLPETPISEHSTMLLLPDRLAHRAIAWLAIQQPAMAQQLLQVSEHTERCYAAWDAARDSDHAFDVIRAAHSLVDRIDTMCTMLESADEYRVRQAAAKLSGRSQAKDVLLLVGTGGPTTVEQFAFALWGDEETPADTVKSILKRANAEFEKAGLGVSVHKRRSGYLELKWKSAP